MALTEKTKTEMRERLQSLPASLSTIITTDAIKDFLGKHEETFSLDEETKIKIANELALVVLCYESIVNLENNLQIQAGISKETAHEIVQMVEKNLLSDEAMSALIEINDQIETVDDQDSLPKNQDISSESLTGGDNTTESSSGQDELKSPTIAAVRTMQDDAQVAQGGQPEERVVHATGQDDLLRRTPTERQPVAASDSPAEPIQQQPTPETLDVTNEEQPPSFNTMDAAGEETRQPSANEAAVATPETPTDNQPTTETAADVRPRPAAQHKPIEDIVVPTKAPREEQTEKPASSQPRPQQSPQPQSAETEQPKPTPRWDSEEN